VEGFCCWVVVVVVVVGSTHTFEQITPPLDIGRVSSLPSQQSHLPSLIADEDILSPFEHLKTSDCVIVSDGMVQSTRRSNRKVGMLCIVIVTSSNN